MQFNVRNGPPSTWDGYGVDGNRDGRLSPYDPADAIPAAARYLQGTGAPEDYRAALFAYNHADWYVAQVLAKAATYRAAPGPGGGLPADPATVRELLRNARILLTPVQRADLLAGGIDARYHPTSARSSEPRRCSRPRWMVAMNFPRLSSSVLRISSA
jgi:hypothetical protein